MIGNRYDMTGKIGLPVMMGHDHVYEDGAKCARDGGKITDCPNFDGQTENPPDYEESWRQGFRSVSDDG